MSSLTDEQRQRIEANRQRALAIRRAKLAEAAAATSAGTVTKSDTTTINNNRNISQSSSSHQSQKSINSNTSNQSQSNSFQKNLGHIPLNVPPNLSNGSSNCSTASSAVNRSVILGSGKASQSHSWPSNNTGSSGYQGAKYNKSKQSVPSFYGSKSTVAASAPSNSKQFSSANSAPIFSKSTTKPVNGTFCLTSAERFMAEVGYHQTMIEVFKSIPSKKYDADTKRWNFSITDHDDLVKKVAPLRPDVCISPLPHYVLKVLREARCLPPLESVDLSCLDPRLREALLPFQVEGVRFGVRREGRVLIADDMGLGKTIQALGIASYYRSDWPLLVVAPSSVRYSWQAALERWMSACRSAVINTSHDVITGYDVIITSYDLLAKRPKEFRDAGFGVVIMDECHMLKNFKSVRYKAATPVIKKAKRAILLSGTPALSRPSELYTQISAVDSRLFPNYQDYGVRYCAGHMGNWGWDYSGSSNLSELQVVLSATVMIRRLKAEVLDQLPAKLRQVIILDPGSVVSSKEMSALAEQLGHKALKGNDRHSALIQFFAQTATAKLKAVSDYLKELLDAGQKFLVFAHHRVMIDKLCQTCEKQKVMYIRIEGSTPGDTRQALVDQFQQRASVRVAVLSITAASTGITLTAASLVVFAELYWNPGILVQAEDRVHRLGQKDSVSVQYLVARDTADDHIWPMVQQKLNILGKAGLSKEDFSDSNATCQKPDESGSILQYLVDLTPDDLKEMETDYDFESDVIETPSKKIKLD